MFDTGIAWLRQRINVLSEDRRHHQALIKSVEEIVDIADTKIRLARSYRKTLLPSVVTASTYCQHIVQSIPGPVRLHPSTYHDNPLVKAIFPSADELETTLRQARNTEIPSGGQELFALLTMSKNEKTIYSHQQQGELLVRDVAMQAVNFVEHRVVAPSTDLQTTKDLLEQRALEVLATVAMERISTLRGNLAELRERRERLAAMHRILGGKRRTVELFAQPDQTDTEKINELRKMLKTTEEEIELSRKEMETPEDALGYLQRIMEAPADSLVLREQLLRLNWMNVIVEDGSQGEVNEITLAELIMNQELQRSAVLVSFDRQES
jgi:hypothetical protein